MRRTEDTILQREVVSRTAQKRAPITAHGSSGCYTVRLPKEYRFSGDDVFIKKIDDIVMLIPKEKVWDTFRESFQKFSSDLEFSHDQDLPQSRTDL
jgi:antitoxin VapB